MDHAGRRDKGEGGRDEDTLDRLDAGKHPPEEFRGRAT